MRRPLEKKPPNTKHSKMRDGFVMHDVYTADGKQKHRIDKGREPFSRLDSKYLSPNAKLLLEARMGSEDAFIRLAENYAHYIEGMIGSHNWKISGNIFKFATVLLLPYTHKYYPTEREAASQIGVHQTSYRSNWKPKIKYLEGWIEIQHKALERV